MNFLPCKAEPSIWMRLNTATDTYEYVAVYVDDLAFAIRDPDDFVKTLEMKYKFKLKGTGPLTFHLGCDFGRDEDGTLFMTPKKYIQRMTNSYEQMFGEKPRRNIRSPIDKDAHLEMDTSDILDEDGMAVE